MSKSREKLSDQVRRAIDASGLSRYAICKALELSQATMSKFMNNKGGLSIECLDALADLLDMNIITGKRIIQRKKR